MAWYDMWSPQSIAEDEEVMSQRGIEGGEEFLEKAYWDSPEEAQIEAGASLNEPEKAVPLAKSVTAAKESGQAGGIGIVPAIFAGLAGAFSDNGVATTNKLMQQWDPKTQAALANKRQGEAQKVEQDQIEMDRTSQRRDAGSDRSVGQANDYKMMFDSAGMPQLGSLFEGRSAEESERLFQSLSPQMKQALDAPALKAKQDETKARRESTEAFQQEGLNMRKDQQRYKQEEDTRRAEERQAAVDLKASQYKTPGEKAADSAYAKDYNDWTTSGRASYDKSMDNLDSAMKELETAQTEFFGTTSGRIAGRIPDWARTDDSRVLQQKVQGAAMGALKATLGTQFTEKEGERIMAISYDPTLEPKENIQKIKSAITELKAQKEAQESKASHWESNEGSLKGWKGEGAGMVSVTSPDGKVGKIPADKLEAALAAGYTRN